jgi:nicotinate (nicotinamide) nucleotide adenylyltransferase
MVKYSAQRISDLNDQDFPRTPAIEIQTRGQDGLRYRRRRPDGTMSGWTDLATVAVPNLEDPCGAGDWLTAAVIHLVGTSHHLNLAAMTDEQLRDLLVAGQACGAWACQYAGARGGMYGDPQSLEEFVVQQTGKRHPLAFRNDGKACLSRDTTLVEAMREFCPICRGDWLPPQDGTSPPTGSVGCWQTGPRPGYAGGQAALKQAELTRRYGPGNWRLGYQWHDAMITREQALEKYAEAYFVHLDKHPEVVEWLVKTAKEVYDTAPSNVDAGTDFLVQEGPATHLQDIAVRQALERLGRKFEGGKLVQIRGKSTPGYRLNPGIVLFHEPDAILQPELDGWWQEGTIESFWQSNKVLQVRPWASRLFVFGGSFNPIHNGHLALARFARDTWGFDRVIFVPNGDSYRKKTLAGTPAKVRLEMVQAATVGEPAMEVLDVEVNDPIAIRTPIRMQELSECHPDSQLVLYRGLDSLPRTHRKCFTLLNLFVLVLDRPGFRLPYSEVLARHRKLEPVLDRIIYLGDAFQDDRSSTQVRNAVAAGRPITALVPPAVEKIIHQRGLYGNKQGR